jgi:diphosphomevalonate decarboxylase
MKTPQDVVHFILDNKTKTPHHPQATAFAPSNIALCKYWGKRNTQLNLPNNTSLSISLGHKGATASITPRPATSHAIIVNDQTMDPNTEPAQRLSAYLDLFRFHQHAAYTLTLTVNIPFAAGLASSACTFAAIIKSIDALFHWQLPPTDLSILARLGSGSAARSILSGFVEWTRGTQADGMDSVACALPEQWPSLCIGLSVVDHQPKKISSRDGMQRTVDTSPLYAAWPQTADTALTQIKTAIQAHDFHALGKAAESNALAMHATMLSAWPPLLYSTPETLTLMQRIWALREAGMPIYFTQDAGPNLKLLFLASAQADVQAAFPTLDILQPFATRSSPHE